MNRFNAINKYRVERWLYCHHLKPLAYFVRMIIYFVHNSFVPPSAEIGKRTYFAYKGIGVVVHSNAKIGDDCMIGTNVTIGGGGGHSNDVIPEFNDRRGVVPIIGNRVYISSGAKVIGNIVIGDDVIIGANAVVINDVPNGAVVAGVPAKIIRYQEEKLGGQE